MPTMQRGGRVTKTTSSTARRGRPGRPPRDSVLNQDPDLENVIVQDAIEHDHQHNSFEHEAAVAAAAAAQHASQQQQQQQQMDLDAASMLVNNGSNLMNSHEHPNLGQHVEGDQPEPHTTESLAHQSGYTNVNIESALAKRLAREPGMRMAQQRRPEQTLNLVRRSNVEALFAHIAGDTAPVPCKNCHKGHGPWTTCVVVDGQMCGSCANCWFNASGARCSFHETRNPQAHSAPVMPNDASFNMPLPAAALGAFSYASASSPDPVVRYTIERAMADIRAADKKARHMLMIEAAAKQLAFQVVTYEETLQEEQQQQQQQQHQHQPQQHQPLPQPPPPHAMMDDNDGP